MLAFYLSTLSDKRDRGKFALVYIKYKNLIYNTCNSILHHVQDSEDITQDVFTYIAKHFNKIGEVNSEKTKVYLLKIAEGRAINLYNHNKKYAEIPDSRLVYNAIDQRIADPVGSAEIKDAIQSVKDLDKICLLLSTKYGMKSAEIAEALKMTPENVRKRIQFARKSISDYMED